eukprot:TRINITY_DN3983_c0_g1_i2.p1 TRINITY_DN3983_c0_g1~~TRINITY_DN3983_c0_g1_i2.p1  ORF type:complete len:737 (-),score=209.05 TRINITY_DN3983_c0_g1_i2:84-2294(-)
MIVKVQVQLTGGVPREFELNRDTSLRNNIEAACKLNNVAGNPSDYTFQFGTSQRYLSDEDLSGDFPIPSNSIISLKLRPEVAAESSLKALKDGNVAVKKKTLFDLRDLLKDELFTRRFLEMEGISSLIALLDDLTGNTLAYGLGALQTAMEYGTGWDSLPRPFVGKLVGYADSNNPNVCKSALKILCLLSDSPKYGYNAISSVLCTPSATPSTATTTTPPPASSATSPDQQPSQQTAVAEKNPLGSIVSLLTTSDIDTQVQTLILINSLIKNAPAGPERSKFLQLLDTQQINPTLKKQLQTTDAEFKRQLYMFQRHRLNEVKARKGVNYDKASPEHEALLMRLWSATFPDVKLEARVSEQWKLIGFQGTDPATDFRGMGIVGLENLLYFAENHGEVFRKIVSTNLARKEREYPVASAGINLSQMLFDLLKVMENESTSSSSSANDHHLFPLLFSHRFAFEEMYGTAFQVLDYTWDDMNASYMDFPRVIAAVKKQIAEVLAASPLSLDQFHSAACSKGRGTIGEDEADAGEPESIKRLRSHVKKEILDLIKTQKLAYLQDGQFFKYLRPSQSKDKKSGTAFVFMKLVDQDLMYAAVSDSSEKPPNSSLTPLKLAEAIGIATGTDIPSFNKKKVSEDIVALAFAILMRDEKTSLELLAQSRDDFVNWTDGLRAVQGKQMETPETQEELKTLITLDMKVRLLDLEGIDNLPRDTLPVPPPPPDFAFVEQEPSLSKAVDK